MSLFLWELCRAIIWLMAWAVILVGIVAYMLIVGVFWIIVWAVREVTAARAG